MSSNTLTNDTIQLSNSVCTLYKYVSHQRRLTSEGVSNFDGLRLNIWVPNGFAKDHARGGNQIPGLVSLSPPLSSKDSQTASTKLELYQKDPIRIRGLKGHHNLLS